MDSCAAPALCRALKGGGRRWPRMERQTGIGNACRPTCRLRPHLLVVQRLDASRVLLVVGGAGAQRVVGAVACASRRTKKQGGTVGGRARWAHAGCGRTIGAEGCTGAGQEAERKGCRRARRPLVGKPGLRCSSTAAAPFRARALVGSRHAPQLNTSPSPGSKYSFSSALSRSSGVRLRQSGATRLALARSSAAAQRSCPQCSARCSGVQPLSASGTSGSAPASSSTSTSPAWLRHTWERYAVGAGVASSDRCTGQRCCRCHAKSVPAAAV